MSPDSASALPANGGPRSAAVPAPAVELYKDLIEGALLGIYVSRPDGKLLACNAAFARMLGFPSAAAALGTSMRDLYDASTDRERFVGSVQEQGRLEHHRGRLRRRDGGVLDVIETVVGEFDSAGVLAELRGFLLDVTANVEAEHALLEREQQFRAVFDDAGDAMLILDDDRCVLEANPSACALFGVPPDAIRGVALDRLFAADDTHLPAAWRELMALGEAQREHRVRPRADQTRIVECSYRARVHGARHLCIARDITDRRIFEGRLNQAEKMESVGRLAGGIAHDFNNLMTAVLGYTELLLSDRAATDPDRHDLEEIQKAGHRAAALTQQLLAFSRKQVLLPKHVDLNKTVTGLQSMLARLIREDIQLSFELSPSPAIVRIDPTQIEQVILNLVLNARDALPDGGQIRLEVSIGGRSRVGALPEGAPLAAELVRLRVVDNGVGISPEARAHIFEPFFTTKAIGKGTGLGLASVYGVVRQSNGFITVESEPGQGSTFTMHFPYVPDAGTSGEPIAVQPESRQGHETVLLVEGEDAVRGIIGAILRRQGYGVVEASGGRVACEIFAQRQDIDLLLTDVVMPDMNGPALAQRLVGLRPNLRVLFISGYADLSSALGGEDNPNVGFLSKPFQAAALTSRVSQMLAREKMRE